MPESSLASVRWASCRDAQQQAAAERRGAVRGSLHRSDRVLVRRMASINYGVLVLRTRPRRLERGRKAAPSSPLARREPHHLLLPPRPPSPRLPCCCCRQSKQETSRVPAEDVWTQATGKCGRMPIRCAETPSRGSRRKTGFPLFSNEESTCTPYEHQVLARTTYALVCRITTPTIPTAGAPPVSTAPRQVTDRPCLLCSPPSHARPPVSRSPEAPASLPLPQHRRLLPFFLLARRPIAPCRS